MKKNNKQAYRHSHFNQDAEYHVELTLAKAHARVAEVMNKRGITQVDLARMLECSEAHVSNLLDDERNFTIKTYGKLMFNLGCEVDFDIYDIGAQREYIPFQPITSIEIPNSVGPISEIKSPMDTKGFSIEMTFKSGESIATNWQSLFQTSSEIENSLLDEKLKAA